MKQTVYILIVWSTVQCYGGTFEIDTVDHWQIYNGSELVFSGWALGVGNDGRIKASDLKELTIRYHHCGRYSDLDVTIEILNEAGEIVLSKNFKIDSGDGMTIEKEELLKLATNPITIRYRERRENEIDLILGRIWFE